MEGYDREGFAGIKHAVGICRSFKVPSDCQGCLFADPIVKHETRDAKIRHTLPTPSWLSPNVLPTTLLGRDAPTAKKRFNLIRPMLIPNRAGKASHGAGPDHPTMPPVDEAFVHAVLPAAIAHFEKIRIP